MKANEIEDGKVLMIGDLVVGCIETDIVGEATYKILCKVTDINHYGDVRCEALEPFSDELDWQDGDDFSWIEPIPLTSDILEKNGFVKQNFDGWEYIHPDDSTFSYIGYRILWRTDYDNHLFIKKYKGSNTSATLQISGINYVHQLQHALRLCGINKTIEL